ncbi:hypothetical protein [Providencia sp. JUb39]|uniref:hypothetical protein n=1 Tax=Providencia sp. JUb39 TaxID=2724165 RepID=UPI00164CF3F6|nr:hypothetical protein [Providencia sp. JUb39]MBC5790599.1 hypothetical protein [Providencia sp. JUb39]
MAKIKTNKKKVKADLDKWKIKETDDYGRKFVKVCKSASVNLQEKINRKIDNPTAFTKRSVGFKFNRTRRAIVSTIYIYDNQAVYLSPYFKGEDVTKFQPVAKNRTNAYGNIRQLNSKKYLKVKTKKGRTILIDPTKKNPRLKKNGKGKTVGRRLVAIKETTSRQAVLGSWKQNKKEILRMINNRMKLI